MNDTNNERDHGRELPEDLLALCAALDRLGHAEREAAADGFEDRLTRRTAPGAGSLRIVGGQPARAAWHRHASLRIAAAVLIAGAGLFLALRWTDAGVTDAVEGGGSLAAEPTAMDMLAVADALDDPLSNAIWLLASDTDDIRWNGEVWDDESDPEGSM